MPPVVPALLCGMGRKVPLKSGLFRLTRSRLVRACLRAQGPGPALATLRNGLRIPVDPADSNGRMLLLFGTPDPKVVHACRMLLRPGDCFLDIGANHGAVGLLCADAVTPGGAVHLFEPQPDLCQRIRSCLGRHYLPHVHLHELALLDRDDQLPLNLHPDHSGAASLMRDDPGQRSVSVAVRNIATYLPPLLQGRPFGAKLDVEGVEIPILRQLLDLPGLRFITLECNSPSDRHELWRLLTKARLHLYGLCRTVLKVQLQRLEHERELPRYHDLLATAPF